MKKYNFTFLFLTILIMLIASCATTRKGGCDCPGMSNNLVEITDQKT